MIIIEKSEQNNKWICLNNVVFSTGHHERVDRWCKCKHTNTHTHNEPSSQICKFHIDLCVIYLFIRYSIIRCVSFLAYQKIQPRTLKHLKWKWKWSMVEYLIEFCSFFYSIIMPNRNVYKWNREFRIYNNIDACIDSTFQYIIYSNMFTSNTGVQFTH